MVLGIMLVALCVAALLAEIHRALVANAFAPRVWHDDYERRLISGRRNWPLE